MQEGALSEHQEVVAALTELARHYVLFAPGTLVQSPALPALVHWAVTAVQLREPEPVSPAASFLTSLVAPPAHIASLQLWQARPLNQLTSVHIASVCPSYLSCPTTGLGRYCWAGSKNGV